MRDQRLRLFWHRAGPVGAIVALAVASEASQGCGGGGSGGANTGGSATTATMSMSSTGTMTTSSTGGQGGHTTTTTTTMTMPFQGSAGVAAEAATALDATPDPSGTTIYFTAIDPTAGPGVFKVPADGSNTTPVVVQAGPPFAAPFGIATSTDGKQLYVADPGATDSTSNQDLGVIFSLPIGGGTPTILSGTELTEARGVEVRQVNNADVLYFTGRDKSNGKVGVFSIPASGGTITMVSEDAQFNDPSGIAIDSQGTIYVADTVASASHTANIFTIKNGTVTPFLSDLRVGYPCGLAITDDDKTLLVSALDPAKATDVLLQVDISSMMTMMDVPAAIAGNYEGAGIHRAKNANIFAWADTSAGPMGGRVYVIK